MIYKTEIKNKNYPNGRCSKLMALVALSLSIAVLGSLTSCAGADRHEVASAEDTLAASAGDGNKLADSDRKPSGKRQWTDDDYRNYIQGLNGLVRKAIQNRCEMGEVKGVILSLANLEREQPAYFENDYGMYYNIFESLVPLYVSCKTSVREIVQQNLKDDDLENFKANLCAWLRETVEGQDDAPGGKAWRDRWCPNSP